MSISNEENLNILKGCNMEVLVRINPEIKENSNIRVFENKVTLLDSQNKRNYYIYK
jgi:hypothetical protein